MKHLKRAAELLTSDEDKYSFLISNENVDKGVFINTEREPKNSILEHLVKLNFCTLKSAKKLNEQQIKNQLIRLNNIFKISETQQYLNSVINGADINDLPKIYELHPAKKTKNNTSLFSEGTGMINSANSCFMISSLQMLFHLEAYMEKLFYMNYTEDLNSIEEEIRNIFAQSQENEAVDIKQFEALIMKENGIKHFFQNGKSKQSDAGEFLQNIHKLLNEDYKKLFEAPLPNEFLSEIFLDINFENIAKNGLDEEIEKSITNEHLNQGDKLSPILLIRLPRMDDSEKDKQIIVPQIVNIYGTKFELKSATCFYGNFF